MDTQVKMYPFLIGRTVRRDEMSRLLLYDSALVLLAD